jgi:hypothetical protein
VDPATTPVIVLYSFWNVQVLMVSGVVLVGAATVPKAMVFTQPVVPEQDVQVMVVVQQVEAVPQAALVLKCRK